MLSLLPACCVSLRFLLDLFESLGGAGFCLFKNPLPRALACSALLLTALLLIWLCIFVYWWSFVEFMRTSPGMDPQGVYVQHIVERIGCFSHGNITYVGFGRLILMSLLREGGAPSAFSIVLWGHADLCCDGPRRNASRSLMLLRNRSKTSSTQSLTCMRSRLATSQRDHLIIELAEFTFEICGFSFCSSKEMREWLDFFAKINFFSTRWEWNHSWAVIRRRTKP